MALDVEWVVNEAQLEELRSDWPVLLPADANPFDSHDWYTAWWQAFGASGGLSVCVARRDGELAGVFPLSRDGPRLEALANVHSGMFRPLFADSEALSAMVDAVLRCSWVELSLPFLPAGDVSLAAIEAGSASARLHKVVESGPISPLVDLADGRDAWLKSKHASWKSRLARYRRKMQRDYDSSFEIVVPPDDLERWLVEGFQLEAGGWKGQAGTAIESAPETAAFYRDVARRFMERDELRLSRIRIDGRPVAFSFCLLSGSRLYSLKTGFDEEWRKLVPGLVLQLSIAEACFELDLDAYELLGDTSDWKQKFANSERSHRNLRLFPRTPRGLSRYLYRSKLRPVAKDAYIRLRGQRGRHRQGR